MITKDILKKIQEGSTTLIDENTITPYIPLKPSEDKSNLKNDANCSKC